MKYAVLDIGNAAVIQSFAQQLKLEHPALNAVVHNAGIMRLKLLSEGKLEDAEATTATNLLGLIRLNAALISPYIQTELTGARHATDPHAMPLEAFTTEVMRLLETQSEATEICVERVKAQRRRKRWVRRVLQAVQSCDDGRTLPITSSL